MSKTLTIAGAVIEFPTSAQSPNWAEAVSDFAEAVEEALSGIVGTYDVAPQIFEIESDVNTTVDLPLMSFPTEHVSGVFIRYSYFRLSDTTTEVETGNIEMVYNETLGTWQLVREGIGTSDPKLTFNVTATGQVQFSTTALGGTYSEGILTYSAQALLKTS